MPAPSACGSPAEGTYHGVTVRTYDPKSGTWSIWWYDGRKPGDLDPPVKGRFKDGVGTFYSDDQLRGKPIKVRFTWSGITATAAHWDREQASVMHLGRDN
jgi:hypothetical protein